MSPTQLRPFFHGTGIELSAGTRLRPSADGFIYATTDRQVAQAMAFRNAVYDWMLTHTQSGRIAAGRVMPDRPRLTGWVVEVTAAATPESDPDFASWPELFVRFDSHARLTVADTTPGAVDSWRTMTSIISPYSLTVDNQPPHYPDGMIRCLSMWKEMGYTDSDFRDLGQWMPIQDFKHRNGRVVVLDEDFYVRDVRGVFTALELIPASVGTNNAAEAAGFWR